MNPSFVDTPSICRRTLGFLVLFPPFRVTVTEGDGHRGVALGSVEPPLLFCSALSQRTTAPGEQRTFQTTSLLPAGPNTELPGAVASCGHWSCFFILPRSMWNMKGGGTHWRKFKEACCMRGPTQPIPDKQEERG